MGIGRWEQEEFVALGSRPLQPNVYYGQEEEAAYGTVGPLMSSQAHPHAILGVLYPQGKN